MLRLYYAAAAGEASSSAMTPSKEEATGDDDDDDDNGGSAAKACAKFRGSSRDAPTNLEAAEGGDEEGCQVVLDMPTNFCPETFLAFVAVGPFRVIFPKRASARSEIGTWRRRLFFFGVFSLEGCHSHSHCHI